MGVFSAKATCAICGKEVGLNRYRMNDMSKIAGKDIWKCPQCTGYYGSQPMQYDPVSDRVTPVTANVDYSGQWGVNNTNTVQDSAINQSTPLYPVVVRTSKNAVMMIISGVFVGAISLFFALDSDNTALFMTVMFWVLTIGSGIVVVIGLLTLRLKVYIVNCPSCGHEIFFPVNDVGCTCQPCQKRLVMTNGVIKLVD